MVEASKAHEFLNCGRIAVVGASDDPGNFGRTIYRALLDRGIDAVAVNRSCETVCGRPCYSSVGDVPGHLDGVLVMVRAETALEVIRAAGERGVPRVWLFKGLGGHGAASAEAVQLCSEVGVDVVAGACPMMFLDPVHGAHRVHRLLRRVGGSISTAA